ncbi:hypothetical protein P6N53_06535 [Desulforamulus aquiferis]|uniref:Uncharacterized protein n=1 Tax=Desulforamulus aquiferis TaxID=1397668 RepID=A0AAW7ZCM8_9FIRM|nr:hypothetical protein [Desulforamulus aquiferis]
MAILVTGELAILVVIHPHFVQKYGGKKLVFSSSLAGSPGGGVRIKRY